MATHSNKPRTGLLPKGCKNIGDTSTKKAKSNAVLVNCQIKRQQVNLHDSSGRKLGVHSLQLALNMAKKSGVDLVEFTPEKAKSPVCMLIDFGLFRFRQIKGGKCSNCGL